MMELIGEVAAFAGADGREPIQLHGEDQHCIDSDDERRDGNRADRYDAGELVDGAVAPHRGKAAERNAQHDGPAQPGGDQRQGVGQRFRDHDRRPAACSTCPCRGRPWRPFQGTTAICTGTGRSRPISRNLASRISGVARGPSMMIDGVAGDHMDEADQRRDRDDADQQGQGYSLERVGNMSLACATGCRHVRSRAPAATAFRMQRRPHGECRILHEAPASAEMRRQAFEALDQHFAAGVEGRLRCWSCGCSSAAHG